MVIDIQRGPVGSIVTHETFQPHAFQTDGLVGAWDHFTGDRTSTGVTVSGLMGEVLKGFARRPVRLDARSSAEAVVGLQSPFDPMGVLTPSARAAVSAGLERRFAELLDAGWTLDHLPDLFYYEHRIPNWLGHSKQVHALTAASVAPLGAVPLARLAFRATAEQRRTELLHFVLMRRTAPELLDVPFALQTWHPSLPGAPMVPAVPLPTGAGPPVRAHGTWQFDLWRPAVRESVAGLTEPAIWEVVDRQALLARLDGPPLGIRRIMSLLGFLPPALLMDGRAGHARIGNSLVPGPPPAYRFEPPRLGSRWPRSSR